MRIETKTRVVITLDTPAEVLGIYYALTPNEVSNDEQRDVAIALENALSDRANTALRELDVD